MSGAKHGQLSLPMGGIAKGGATTAVEDVNVPLRDAADVVDAPDAAEAVAAVPSRLAADDVELPVGVSALPEPVLLGTLGWLHPEWDVWAGPRSVADLEREGLREYAGNALFRTLCIEPDEEELPTEQQWRRYAAQLPEGMPCAVRVPNDVTQPRFKRTDPAHHRLGGVVNRHFLDAHYMETEILAPLLAGFRAHLGPIIFSFPQALASSGVSPGAFAERLHRFLSQLPPGLAYAVELRDRAYLTLDHAWVLADRVVSHVFTSAPAMPSFAEQARSVPSSPELIFWLADPVVPGGPYASEAQRRAALVKCVRTMRSVFDDTHTYVLVGDAAEGSAPETVVALTEALSVG